MTGRSYVRNLFKSRNLQNKDYRFQNGEFNLKAEDFILNMVIPIPIAGEIHEDAMKEYKEEVATIHLQHRHLESIRLLAGSSADGLSLPEVTVQKGDLRFTEGPDEDVMYIFTALRVDKGNRRSFCMTDSTQSSPGYTRLVFNTDWLKKRPSKNHREQNEELMIKKSYLDFLDPCTSLYVNRNKLLKILRNILRSDIHSPEMEKRLINYDVDDISQVPEISYSHHGPALTVDRTALGSPKSMIYVPKDYVVALPCPRWPEEAADWITRTRLWPPKSLINQIVKRGCYIVPKQDKTAEDYRDFLISFSQCEKVLALNLNICQKRCYMLLKYLFKYSINKTKRGLSTYHCKTVFLYRCENTFPEQWTTSNVLECLSWLLSDLEQYLKTGWLPQYFIPEMNLISAIGQKTIDSIVQDITKVRLSPVHTILELLASKKFDWFSVDKCVENMLHSLVDHEKFTLQTAQQTMVDLVSVWLDKGETDIAVSILCDSQNAQIMPPTEDVIEVLESIAQTEAGQSSTAITGLLASLYHERALEYGGTNVDGNLMKQSYDLFENVIKDVGRHVWIVGDYFNLLYGSEKYATIVKIFMTMLRTNTLFEGGIYTTIGKLNILTVDPVIREAAVFTVPSLVYISYMAIMACTKIASSADQSYGQILVCLASKILRNLSVWYENKHNMYPEDIDENIHIALGLCYRAVGNVKHYEKHFRKAESFNCTYGARGDDLIFKPSLTDNIRNAFDKQETGRFHPYHAIGKKVRQPRLDCKRLRIRSFILKPFLHY
ncbi:hypothetical protein ACF0H5_015503 [Mactra antiquata]